MCFSEKGDLSISQWSHLFWSHFHKGPSIWYLCTLWPIFWLTLSLVCIHRHLEYTFKVACRFSLSQALTIFDLISHSVPSSLMQKAFSLMVASNCYLFYLSLFSRITVMNHAFSGERTKMFRRVVNRTCK